MQIEMIKWREICRNMRRHVISILCSQDESDSRIQKFISLILNYSQSNIIYCFYTVPLPQAQRFQAIKVISICQALDSL